MERTIPYRGGYPLPIGSMGCLGEAETDEETETDNRQYICDRMESYMDYNDIRELLAALDEASTQARMLRVVADDLEAVIYRSQVAIAQLQHEVDGRKEHENMG